MRKPFAAVLIVLCALMLTGVSACQSTNPADAENQAVAAATQWLSLLDGGKYEDAWNNSDDAIKNVGNKEQFARAMARVRAPLGNEVGRQVQDKAYAKDPQNAPPGEYVQIHFHASFEKSKSVLELVTLRKQADGTWKVGQYEPSPEE